MLTPTKAPPRTNGILIVDDERVVARDLERTLTQLGYAVAGRAGSGEEAVRQARALEPSLVLMDIHLGEGMDGVDAAREIREGIDVPIVYLTAFSDRETLERAKATAPAAYLMKPFRERDVVCTIELAKHRHANERALRARVRTLDDAVTAIGTAVVTTDADARVTYLNPVAQHLTGWTDADARGRDIADVVRLAHADVLVPVSVDVARGETTLTRAGGESVAVEDCSAPVRDDEDALIGRVLVMRDASERRETQVVLDALRGQLAQSSARFHTLMNCSSDSVIVFDRERRIRDVNPAAEALLRAERHDVVGTGVEDWIDGPSYRRACEEHGRPQPNGTLTVTGAPIDWRDGRRTWLDFSTTIVSTGGEEVAITTVRDVTDRHLAAVAVEQSEERFRTLVSSMNDFVFTLDERGRVDGIYGAGLDREGASPAELLGKRAAELFAADTASVHEGMVERALAGEHTTFEWSIDVPDGRRSFETRLSPLAGERAHGVVGITRELTEQKQRDLALMTSDRLASIGVMTAGLAHEINNPLTAIIANLDSVRAELTELCADVGLGVTLGAIRQEITDAYDASQRVRAIVRDLRVFSRADDGTAEAVDPVRVMESSLRIARVELRHRARVVEDYRRVAPVAGTEACLGQLFLNLLVNAAQAFDDADERANQIRISIAPDGDRHVRVEIADNGPGIPPAVRSRMFQPFVTTKPPGVGTGLGLSICRRIVTKLGGEISVESEEGLGTKFTIRLPTAEQPAVAAPPSVPPRSKDKVRVLVIDDDPMIARALRRVLGEHDVTTVNAAADAIVCLERGERFDVILCDLAMPAMNGVDFYEAVGERWPERLRSIVFITGGATTMRARALLDRIANPRIGKPCDPRTLRDLVAAHAHACSTASADRT